jgi:hypothetical protein
MSDPMIDLPNDGDVSDAEWQRRFGLLEAIPGWTWHEPAAGDHDCLDTTTAATR